MILVFNQWYEANKSNFVIKEITHSKMGQIHYTFQIHLQFTGGASVEYF